jgi:hypothetical protein
MTRRRVLVWGVPALLYLAFAGWYTDLGGPLRPDEVEAYVEKLAAQGLPAASLDRIRRFMESDTGRQFLMVNAIDYAEDPPDVPGAAPGE